MGSRGRWLVSGLVVGALAVGLWAAATWSYGRAWHHTTGIVERHMGGGVYRVVYEDPAGAERQAEIGRVRETFDDQPARGGDEWPIRIRRDDPAVVQHHPPPTFGADAIRLAAAALLWFALAAAIASPQFDWSPANAGRDEYGYWDR